MQVNQVYFEDVESTQQAGDSATAANTSAGSASASKDAAGASASAANQSRIDAQAANGSAQSAASAANGSAVAANASASSAQTSAVIASSYSATGAVIGDKFANWPEGAQYPSPWYSWAAEGNYRVQRVAPGIGSTYGVQTLNDGPETSSGFMQVITVTPGLWVIEATARLDANNIEGAGVTIHGQLSIDFARDPDVNGVVSAGMTGVTRTWTKTVNLGQQFVNDVGGRANFHAMVGWTGFGYRQAKYMTWFRVTARPADAGVQQAVANAARIETVNTTLATSVGNLATSVSNVTSRIGAVESSTSIMQTAVSNLQTGQSAARLELTAVSPGGRAQIAIRSSNNGGAGVDITSDVNIIGSSGGATTKITNLGVSTYDSTGALVFQCGIY